MISQENYEDVPVILNKLVNYTMNTLNIHNEWNMTIRNRMCQTFFESNFGGFEHVQ